MIIFSKNITPRLQYILDFFSKEISDEKWTITSNTDEFRLSEEVKINYSNTYFDFSCVRILPHQLLFETGIVFQNINCTKKEGVKIFFQNESDIGFDIFAASFYLLSRYEEYFSFTPDKHGRYPHENSLAYKEGFLNKPLINIWIEKFKIVIINKFPSYKFREKHFRFLPTYDIDIAWSYCYKGFWRNTANLVKDFFSLSFSAFFQRLKVLSDLRKDPFDVFEWLDQLHEKYELKPFYFFLVAEKLSKFDKNISPHHAEMQTIIADHVTKYSVGLHPSYRSNSYEAVLKEEKNILSEILKTDIKSSRQHYLKIALPATYRSLSDVGIENEYSMGYAGSNGFRASVASSFRWYDLEKEQETSLLIFPFCYMEATSMFYKNDSPQQALEELIMLYHEVKKIKGFFSMIWHNSSFCDESIYAGWKKVYEKFIEHHYLQYS